jgi:hypothetical protein
MSSAASDWSMSALQAVLDHTDRHLAGISNSAMSGTAPPAPPAENWFAPWRNPTEVGMPAAWRNPSNVVFGRLC